MLKNKTKKFAAASVLAMVLMSGAAFTEAAQAQTVTKAGSSATVQAHPKNFTGTAWRRACLARITHPKLMPRQ